MSAALEIPEGGFDITENPLSLPREFLSGICENVFIEFLRTSSAGESVSQTNMAKNHAVLKIDFTKMVLGYEGVRLAMDVNFDLASTGPNGEEPSYKPGKLCIKPVGYKAASRSSARTCQLALSQGVSLNHIIQTIVYYKMQEFSFVNINDKYYGCRDFIAQALWVLERAGYIGRAISWSHVNNPPTTVQVVYDALGMRWAMGRAGASPIDRGNFDIYCRIEAPEIPYAGSSRCQQIMELVRRL